MAMMPLESIIDVDVTSMIVLRLLCPADWSLDLDPPGGRLKIWGGAAECGMDSRNLVLSYGALVCQLLYQLLRESTKRCYGSGYTALPEIEFRTPRTDTPSKASRFMRPYILEVITA
jgi:hypothetical protein